MHSKWSLDSAKSRRSALPPDQPLTFENTPINARQSCRLRSSKRRSTGAGSDQARRGPAIGTMRGMSRSSTSAWGEKSVALMSMTRPRAMC